VVGFDLSAVNILTVMPPNKLTGKLVLSKKNIEDGRWKKMAQDCVQWWALVLTRGVEPSGSSTIDLLK
jgi:hypothetical protein